MIPRSHAGEAHPVLQHAWNRRIRGIYEEHWNTTALHRLPAAKAGTRKEQLPREIVQISVHDVATSR
jgi:hypothetical protein